MTYKLNAKLIPFLIKEESTGELIAKVTPSTPGYVSLQLDEGVTVSVKEDDLGIKVGKSMFGKLYFDNEGMYLNASFYQSRSDRRAA